MDVGRIAAFLVKNKDAIGALSAAFGIGVAIAKGALPFKGRLIAWTARRNLRTLIGADGYSSTEVKSATRFYLYPDCQSLDPSGNEDWRAIYPVRAKLFKTVDDLLESSPNYKHTILLADSGMGKTSFALNYYARHVRSGRKRLSLELIPLGSSNAESRLAALRNREQRNSTVVILDAFDEDTKAIAGHRERIAELLQYADGYRHVFITCRTQFFLSDDEIPRETGVLRMGVTQAGQSKEYQFYKIYLSPFSDDQVRSYLRRRLPIWRLRDRRLAFEICRRIADLAVRPMLLDYIPTLIKAHSDWRYACQIYEEMVKAWIKREAHFLNHKEGPFLEFSEKLAVNLYVNRVARGSESVQPSELEQLASTFGLSLQGWQLTGRSLLNRTADGKYKFAHRSVMEFLFARRFLNHSEEFEQLDWTDQIKRFVIELILSKLSGGDNLANVDFGRADLDGWTRLGWKILLNVRNSTKKSVSAHASVPFIGRTYNATLRENTVQPPIMVNTLRGLRFGSEALRHILAETLGSDSLNREALLDAQPIENFHATCSFDLASNRMWALLPLDLIEHYEEVRQNLDLCNLARLNAFEDWRLPSRGELRTLLNRHTLFDQVIARGVWCTEEFVPLPVIIGKASEEVTRGGGILLTRNFYEFID